MDNTVMPTSISNRLIKEAIRQSSQKGAGSVSAKAIVKAVGCSDRLIQYYFTSVEGMWTEAVRYCQNALLEAYGAFFASRERHTLFDVWRFAYGYTVNHPDETAFYSQVKLLGLYSYKQNEKMNDLMIKAFRAASPCETDDEFAYCRRMEFICDNANSFARRVMRGELPGDEASVRLYMNITFGLFED